MPPLLSIRHVNVQKIFHSKQASKLERNHIETCLIFFFIKGFSIHFFANRSIVYSGGRIICFQITIDLNLIY